MTSEQVIDLTLDSDEETKSKEPTSKTQSDRQALLERIRTLQQVGAQANPISSQATAPRPDASEHHHQQAQKKRVDRQRRQNQAAAAARASADVLSEAAEEATHERDDEYDQDYVPSADNTVTSGRFARQGAQHAGRGRKGGRNTGNDTADGGGGASTAATASEATWDGDDAGKPSRKPRRTREEIARDAEERKRRKEAEALARKQQRKYDSDRYVLTYLRAVLDPRLMTTPLGLHIATAFQQTRSKAEHEHIHYEVSSTGLRGLGALKWVRQVPVACEQPSGEGGATQQSQTMDAQMAENQSTSLNLVDVDEADVLLCFEAEEFVEHVLKDRLASVFAQLKGVCPHSRPHILVHRLDAYLKQREQADFRQSMMQSATAASSCAAAATAALNAGGAAGNHATNRAGGGNVFCRRVVDEFVVRMSVECPKVGFRDVAMAEQGAQHVVSLTTAVARRVTEKPDATKFLLGQSTGSGNKKAQAASSLLAKHPIEDLGVKTLMRALSMLPSVGPQIAHAVATRYGSLGALMEFCTDSTTSYTHKVKELEAMERAGNSGRVTRVGPAAAKMIVQLLTADNEDMAVHGGGA